MERRLGLILIIYSAFLPALLGEKKPKPPEVEIVQISAHRREDLVLIDGKFKNVSDKPIRRLRYIVDFLATDNKQILTTRNSEIDDDLLDPGAEAEVHGQIESPAGAVSVNIHFEDAGKRELRAARTGPFPIE